VFPEARGWSCEHKPQAYQIIKDAREELRFASKEIEKVHIILVEALIRQAWTLYQKLNHDWRLSEAKPRDVFAKLKEAQALIGESYLKKINRDDLRDKVDGLWKLVQQSQRQYEERQRARDTERAEKQREWRERQEGISARWQSRIDNGSAFIERLESQVEELQEKKDGARTGEFADRVQGWIDEKREKIAEVQTEINELRNRISDVQQRLEENRDRCVFRLSARTI
jgi:hypothetical protein